MAMLPPGPRIPSPIQLFWWLSRPISFFDHCTQRYGNCFTASFPGLPPSVFISDPDMIRDVFQGDSMELHSGKSNATWMEPLVGSHSILVLDGEKHRRARKLMSPPFKSDRMQVYASEMREVVDEAIDRWSLGTPFPVHPEMQRITLHITLRSVFGIDKAAQFDRLTELLSQLLGQSTKSTLYSALAVLLRKQLKEPETRKKIEAFMPKDSFFGIKREVDELIYSEIAQRRSSTEKRTDMLSLLMEARDENGEAMNDEVPLRPGTWGRCATSTRSARPSWAPAAAPMWRWSPPACRAPELWKAAVLSMSFYDPVAFVQAERRERPDTSLLVQHSGQPWDDIEKYFANDLERHPLKQGG